MDHQLPAFSRLLFVSLFKSYSVRSLGGQKRGPFSFLILVTSNVHGTDKWISDISKHVLFVYMYIIFIYINNMFVLSKCCCRSQQGDFLDVILLF